jgi:hypothetical protein
MKKISVALFFAAQLCLYSCLTAKTGLNENTLPGKSTTLIRIEFKDGQYVIQQIVLLLRSLRLDNLDLYKSYLVDDRVEARFCSLTKEKEQRLKQQLEQVAGVLYVDIVKNGIPSMPTASPFL